MSRVLVDTSVWIQYFRNEDRHSVLSELIAENLVCTNDLILAELVPVIHVRGHRELIEGLMSLKRYAIAIDWPHIINMQVSNLRHGINGVGIPDLIVVENALANDLMLFSQDKHFQLMKKVFDFRMFSE